MQGFYSNSLFLFSLLLHREKISSEVRNEAYLSGTVQFVLLDFVQRGLPKRVFIYDKR